MKPLFVYITCQNEDQALEIAKVIVEEKLAACANILPGMKSVYYWEDALQVDQEAVLILKSHEALYEQLENRVKELHSYDVPAILAIPLVAGNAQYIEWMAGEMLV